MSTYTDLAAELLAGHPVTGAYSADPQTAANELNAENIPAVRETMTGSELWAQTDTDQLASLTAERRSEWLSFCGIDEHDTTADGVAQKFGVSVFSGATVNAGATEGNIGAARSYNRSRGEIIGFGRVRAGDVEYARSL